MADSATCTRVQGSRIDEQEAREVLEAFSRLPPDLQGKIGAAIMVLAAIETQDGRKE